MTNTINKEAKIARKFTAENIYEGQWKSFGGGETGCELYFSHNNKNYYVGELSGDNGLNRHFNPSGERWAEKIEDKPDEWHIATWMHCQQIINN